EGAGAGDVGLVHDPHSATGRRPAHGLSYSAGCAGKPEDRYSVTVRPAALLAVLRAQDAQASLCRADAPRLIASTASRRLIAPKGEPPAGWSLPKIQVGPSARCSSASSATSRGSGRSPWEA